MIFESTSTCFKSTLQKRIRSSAKKRYKNWLSRYGLTNSYQELFEHYVIMSLCPKQISTERVGFFDKFLLKE